MKTNIHGAVLSRRQFVKTGGSLMVGVGLVGSDLLTNPLGAAPPTGGKNTLDPRLLSSWIEIHADNTMTLRTGKSDFGQSSATTAFRQLVADELYFPYERITSVIMGDTDRTPDGGFSASLLALGGQNLQKVAAYTREAILEIAATKLGVAKNGLSLADGVVSGGGKSVTYGEIVSGQQLTLNIPVAGELTVRYGLSVTGNPPMKPVSQYTVVGKSYKNELTPLKVTGKENWITSVQLPGMLHGRVIHPKTLGSALISAGTLDRKRFPNAKVIVQKNFVGVVAPTEWEAVRASQQVAAGTTWTDWKGLPTHETFYTWLREQADWKTAPVTKGRFNKGDAPAALSGAAKKFSATYELPFLKHAPIGPTMAVADVKADGTVFVYARNQNPSLLRNHIALMLGIPFENVVVRVFAGAGHYGRSNGGTTGAEDDAVLLSNAVGKPVRVLWTRQDDMLWSTSSPGGYSSVQIALDAQGNMISVQQDHFLPAGQDDRPVGAILAEMPTIRMPDTQPTGVQSIVNALHDPWVYDGVPNLAELAHGTWQLGQQTSPTKVGIRNHSLRTPWQLQQNHPRELAINEAAALAGVDPIEYRIRHTKDARLIGVLNAVREASGWQARPSPGPKAAVTGSAPLIGRGVSAILRLDTYWACVCEVSIVPVTGKIAVTTCVVAADPGIVINPLQFKRQIEGGAIMGISHTLYEEMRFDESGITSRDWRSYPIATMNDVPDMKIVIISNPKAEKYGGGSEAANALALPAITAAVHDATGKVPRRLPLTPSYVQRVLKG